jgi:hypothetical protein
MFEYIKGVIRSLYSKDRQYNDQSNKDRQYNDQSNKDRQYNDQSNKARQYNDQSNKDKETKNDLQNTTQKTKDWVTRTPLKTGGEFVWPGFEIWVFNTTIHKMAMI